MHKTGTYEAQIGGYAAFMPAPLPDGTAFDVSSLYALISQADRAVARLDGSIHTIPSSTSPMYETYYRLFEPQAAPRNGA